MPDSLPSVEAYWSTPYNVDVWARLLTFRADVELLGAEAEDMIVLGPVLPSGMESRVAQAFALRDKGKSVICWTLSVRPPPEGAAPPDVQVTDTQLGGRDGLARLLSETSDAATLCEYRIETRFEASEWSCVLLPRPADTAHADAPIQRLGVSARIESIGYRFSSRGDGITEVHITYHPKRHHFFVQLFGCGRLILSDDTWLPGTSDVLLTTRSTLFVRKKEDVT